MTGLVLLTAACGPSQDAVFWQQYVNETRSAGFFRTDRSPDDAPFTAAQLAKNFEALAFDFEEQPFDDEVQTTPARMIRKWLDPVRYTLVGAAEGNPQLSKALSTFTGKLGALTGHPVAEAVDTGREQPNVLVLFGASDFFDSLDAAASLRDSGSFGDELDEKLGALAFLNDMVGEWRRSTSPCGGRVGTYDRDREEGQRGEIFFAIIMIRAEVPPSLMQACVEEEFAQVMGLFNDDFDVRPTIFNDDQEFALLTRHDELLLQILYDARLPLGAPPEQAMPVVRRIAGELVR